MTETRTLATKLSEVMGLVGWIPKKGKNTAQNYEFVREVDIVDAVSQLLAERHIAIIPHVVDKHFEPITTAKGTGGFFAVVTMSYTFVDGDSGETQTAEAVGAGTDYPGDKSFYKAQTGAKKYALTQAFLIATGEDPEDEQAEKKGNASKAPPAQKQAPKPAAQPPQQRTATAATPGSRGDLVARIKAILPEDHPQYATLSAKSPKQLEALAKSLKLEEEVMPSAHSRSDEHGQFAQPDHTGLPVTGEAQPSPEGDYADHWESVAKRASVWIDQVLTLAQSLPEGKDLADLKELYGVGPETVLGKKLEKALIGDRGAAA